MSESIIKTKSYELAVSGIKFYKSLISDKKEFVMSKQFFKSIYPQCEEVLKIIRSIIITSKKNS